MKEKVKVTEVKKKKHEKRKLGRNGMAAEAKRDLCNYSRRTFPVRFGINALDFFLNWDDKYRRSDLIDISKGNIPDVTLPCTRMQR